MRKELYLDLCTRGFYRLLWGNNNSSDKQFGRVRKQVAQLSKRQRVQMLNWVALQALKAPGDELRGIKKLIKESKRFRNDKNAKKLKKLAKE